MLETILTGILSFIFGGGLATWYKIYFDKRAQDLSFFEEELKRYKEAYDHLKSEVDKLKLSILPSAVPEWRKDIRGRYVYVSPNFELFLLLPLDFTSADVIGKTDEEVFKDYPEFIEVLRSLDFEVRRSMRKFAVRRNVKFPGHPETLMVITEISQAIDGMTYFIGRCYPEYDLYERETTKVG